MTTSVLAHILAQSHSLYVHLWRRRLAKHTWITSCCID